MMVFYKFAFARSYILNLVGLIILLSSIKFALASDGKVKSDFPEDSTRTVQLTFALAQQRLFTHNHSLKRAYEGLYQAHNRIAAAKNRFLPNPEIFAFAALAGPTGAIAIGGVLGGVHTLSLPEAIFEYQANKRLAIAEQYYLEATIRNMQEHVSRLYFQLLADQALYEAMVKKCALTKEILTYHHHLNAVGAGSEMAIKENKGEYIECEKELVKINTLISEEMSELKMLLGFEEDVVIELTKVEADSLEYFTLALEPKEAYLETVEQAPELAVLDYAKLAAEKIRKGEELTFFSFRGFGLGHSHRVNIAESKVREIEIESQNTRLTLVNQISLTYDQITDQLATNRLVHRALKAKQVEMQIIKDAYDNRTAEYEAVCKKKMELLKVETDVILSKYATKLLLAIFARQVGYLYEGGFTIQPRLEIFDARKFCPDFRYEVIKHEGKSGRVFNLYLANPLMDLIKIASIRYSHPWRKRETLVGENFSGYRYHFHSNDKSVKVKVYLVTRFGEKIKGYIVLRKQQQDGAFQAVFHMASGYPKVSE